MRIRSIKPEFWQSERLATLPRDARLLFIGLWNMADDHGRFRAHPAVVRGMLFPFDSDADVEGWLKDLERAGRITLYEKDGQRYGWVRNFEEHQKIDSRAKSRLPDPPPPIPADSRQKPAEPADSRQELVLEQGAGSREMEQGAGREELESAPADPPPLADDWRELCPHLPQWEKPSKGRRKAARKALERRPREQWREVFRRIATSRFCAGENDRGWKADLDWALRPEGTKPEPAACVLEGKYDNRSTGPPAKDIRRGSTRAEDFDGLHGPPGEHPF